MGKINKKIKLKKKIKKLIKKKDIFRLSIPLQIATYLEMSQRHSDLLCTKNVKNHFFFIAHKRSLRFPPPQFFFVQILFFCPICLFFLVHIFLGSTFFLGPNFFFVQFFFFVQIFLKKFFYVFSDMTRRGAWAVRLLRSRRRTVLFLHGLVFLQGD